MTDLDTTNYRYYAKQRIVDGILDGSSSSPHHAAESYYLYLYYACIIYMLILICEYAIVFILNLNKVLII